MTGGKIHPFIKCHHCDHGDGAECGGDLRFSYSIADEDRTDVYICIICGGRVNVT